MKFGISIQHQSTVSYIFIVNLKSIFSNHTIHYHFFHKTLTNSCIIIKIVSQKNLHKKIHSNSKISLENNSQGSRQHRPGQTQYLQYPERHKHNNPRRRTTRSNVSYYFKNLSTTSYVQRTACIMHASNPA